MKPRFAQTALAVFLLCVAARAADWQLSSDNDSGDLRIGIVVYMTDAGRKLVPPTRDNPAYYYPRFVGDKELGDVLVWYQRDPPTPAEVQETAVPLLSDNGYEPASPAHPPSLILAFQWGEIAPIIAHLPPSRGSNVFGMQGVVKQPRAEVITVNRDEIMTYIAGEDWYDYNRSNTHFQALMSGGTSRYYLIVTAWDWQEEVQHHRTVMLWRAHITTPYWGHYLDEALPSLIAAGASRLGRETKVPDVVTMASLPKVKVTPGNPVLMQLGVSLPPATDETAFRSVEAVSDAAEERLSEQRDEAESPQAPQLAESPDSPGPAASGDVVRLPPYIITSAFPLTWQHASVPGFEILSCCGPTDTERFAYQIAREQEWLDELVSPDLQPKMATPTAVILFDADVIKLLSQSVEDLARSVRDHGGAPSRKSPELIAQVRLSDSDSTSAAVDLQRESSDQLSQAMFDPNYVSQLLARRVPALPNWFITALAQLYGTRARVKTGLDGFGSSNIEVFSWPIWISQRVTLQVWNPPPAFQYGETGVPSFPILIPMREMLTGPMPPPVGEAQRQAWLAARVRLSPSHPRTPEERAYVAAQVLFAEASAADSPWRQQAWSSQAALFMGWALEDPTRGRLRALWRFAAISAVEPASGKAFAACFGFGFSEMDARLARYDTNVFANLNVRVPIYAAGALPRRAGRLTLALEKPVDEKIDVRRATAAEEARLLGDWQRKEAEFIAQAQPRYAERYLGQAELTLEDAYERGVRDPGLLAALGLLKCAEHDDDRAQAYLEAAVKLGATRPRAYVELARIRLAAALAVPAGKGGRLSRAQAAPVLALLQAAQQWQPPQIEGFLLAIETLENSDFAPVPADVALVGEGLHFYPTDPRLVIATAQLAAAAGYDTQAVRVLDAGLEEVTDPRARSVLVDLRKHYAN